MKNISKTILAVFATGLISCALFTQQAQAIPITGGISMAGGFTTDTGDVDTATAFTSFTNVVTTTGSGSYLSVPPTTSVTMTPFSFNPFSGPVTPLWSFVFGGATYSFDLNVLTSVSQPGDDTLTIRGTGILMISGGTYDLTPGAWLFTGNQGGGTFAFSSSTSAVPDGGTTVALLGIALAGIEGARRMFRARKA
jgi:VPDSG-CTERM motif